MILYTVEDGDGDVVLCVDNFADMSLDKKRGRGNIPDVLNPYKNKNVYETLLRTKNRRK